MRSFNRSFRPVYCSHLILHRATVLSFRPEFDDSVSPNGAEKFLVHSSFADYQKRSLHFGRDDIHASHAGQGNSGPAVLSRAEPRESPPPMSGIPVGAGPVPARGSRHATPGAHRACTELAEVVLPYQHCHRLPSPRIGRGVGGEGLGLLGGTQ
jgi:hypothetical protein